MPTEWNKIIFCHFVSGDMALTAWFNRVASEYHPRTDWISCLKTIKRDYLGCKAYLWEVTFLR